MWAARVVVWGFDLGADEGFDVLAEHYNPRCSPPWSEPELRRKCDQATDPAFKHPRGWLLNTERDRPAPRDPGRPVPQFDVWGTSPPAVAPGAAAVVTPRHDGAVTDRDEEPTPAAAPSPARPAPVSIGAELAEPVAPPAAAGQGGSTADPLADLGGVDPADPFRLARGFLAERHYDRGRDCSTLRYWDARFARWKGGAYTRADDAAVRSDLLGWIEAEFQRLHRSAMKLHDRNQENGQPDKDPPKKLKATRAIVGDAAAAVEQLCRVPDDCSPPCWIGAGPPPAELVACRNGLVHVPAFLARRPSGFIPATPRFISCVRTDFDFDPHAPEPANWLAFLDSIWPGDPDSVACLQEWFGYLLTPDTSLHKMLMIVGPPRAGKGTINRVLRALVGKDNCAAPTLSKLGDRFALADLLDKTVAIFADAHLSGRADSVAIIEELLSISGEDARTVDVKHKNPVTTTLRTRFVFFANELPRLGDSSGAIVSRFVFLRLTESFVGREDRGLLDRLLPELPGILLWALAGWQRLRDRGQFTAPESAEEMREDADALASPVKVWAAECCELVVGH